MRAHAGWKMHTCTRGGHRACVAAGARTERQAPEAAAAAVGQDAQGACQGAAPDTQCRPPHTRLPSCTSPAPLPSLLLLLPRPQALHQMQGHRALLFMCWTHAAWCTTTATPARHDTHCCGGWSDAPRLRRATHTRRGEGAQGQPTQAIGPCGHGCWPTARFFTSCAACPSRPRSCSSHQPCRPAPRRRARPGPAPGR